MHRPLVRHCAAGGHQGLSGHLPAEHALPALPRRTAAAEDILLDLLEVEQADDFVEWLGHSALRAALPAPLPAASSAELSADASASLPSSALPVAAEASALADSLHSSSTAAPYRSSFTTPTPATLASCARVTGRVAAIVCSVASEKTT